MASYGPFVEQATERSNTYERKHHGTFRKELVEESDLEPEHNRLLLR